MSRKKWSDIRAKVAPETLEAAAELLTSMRLSDLRVARGPTQSLASCGIKESVHAEDAEAKGEDAENH